ncbi:hypothetical protein GMORB2_7359 [Geosmithia morbida]|uniref:Uncharacterized protein n=1 Tax=Geosmithia morbida TaxID=1094350 RepID=A0A9P4YTP5_9HYPO|nr:uncharacterized protein GMORB2_7359 [Geosmithia morbida]KAF4122367.1 hypothetical protein GMORB2_7359 [Geosmithia morbida]
MQNTTRRVPTKLIATVATALVAGYGVRTYTSHVRDARNAAAEAEALDAERRRRNEALMDEFGARGSIADIERAVQFYEKKN